MEFIKFIKKYFFVFLIAAGGLLCGDTLVLLVKTQARSLGVFLPFLIGAPVFICGVFHNKIYKLCERYKPVRFASIFVTVCYAAFCVLFMFTTVLCVACGHRKASKNADVLIVLGCSVIGDRVSLTLANRLDAAIEYLNENPNTVVVVSGGKGGGENVSEADAMSKYLILHGISESRIYKENESTSTEENFKYSKKIIDELFPNGAKITFVTTHFHVFRAQRVAKRCGIDAKGIGANGVWYITFNDYLRECFAVAGYFVTGRL